MDSYWYCKDNDVSSFSIKIKINYDFYVIDDYHELTTRCYEDLLITDNDDQSLFECI